MKIANCKLIVILAALLLFLAASSAEAATIGRPQNNLGLVGYWDFDMGKRGTVVYDRSGNNNHGNFDSLMDPANDWVEGKIGGAIDFDEDLAEITTGSIDYGIGAGDFTISVWVNRQSNNTNFSAILGVNGTNPGFYVEANGGFIGATVGEISTASTVLTIGEWSHVVLRRTNSTVEFFVDTVRDAVSFSNAAPFGSGVIAFGTTALGSTQNHSDILLDEVRIYNRSLSLGEISRLHKLGEGGGQTLGGAQNVVTEGLLGHYTFDGTNITNATATDSTSNGNDGTLSGGLSSTDATIGKLGQALSFDGASDYVDLDSVVAFETVPLTISTWIKTTDTAGAIFTNSNNTRNCGSNLALDAGRIEVMTGDCAGTNHTHNTRSVPTYNDDEWHHVVAIVNGWADKLIYVDGEEVATTTSGASSDTISYTNAPSPHHSQIGDSDAGGPGGYFAGILDDVRVYDRALSADEVRRIHGAGGGSHVNSSFTSRLTNGLIGHWTFDGPDITNATATDLSGNGNDGAFAGGLGTGDATMGKIGQALEFDGVSDYVNAGQVDSETTGAFTYSIWMKPQVDQTRALMQERNGTSGTFLYANTGALIQFGVGGSADDMFTPTDSITIGEWNHVVATFRENGSNDELTVYINGVLSASNNTITASYGAHAFPFTVGANFNTGSANLFFDGLLDEARVYNRALSVDEVEALYRMGR